MTHFFVVLDTTKEVEAESNRPAKLRAAKQKVDRVRSAMLDAIQLAGLEAFVAPATPLSILRVDGPTELKSLHEEVPGVEGILEDFRTG